VRAVVAAVVVNDDKKDENQIIDLQRIKLLNISSQKKLFSWITCQGIQWAKSKKIYYGKIIRIYLRVSSYPIIYFFNK